MGQPFPADSQRGLDAGKWLCSEEFPYRGWLHYILGDMEFFSNHLGTPGPNANSPCWLCDCDREDNPWNDFVKDLHSPNNTCSQLSISTRVKHATCIRMRMRMHISRCMSIRKR